MSYKSPDKEDWFLSIEDPLLDHADLYIVKPDGSVKVKRSGQLIKQSAREISARSPSFKIEGTPHTTDTLYLRVASDDPLQLQLSLYSSTAMIEDTFNSTALIGGYYGIMLVMLLYNLFLFATLRERSYLFYCIYLACLIPAQMSFDGLSYQLLCPNPLGGRTVRQYS